MSGRDAVRLVAERELREGMRSRAWRISLAVQVAIVVGIAIVSVLTGGEDGPSKREVAVSGPAGAAILATARDDQAAYGIELEAERVPDHAAGRRAVESEDVDAALGQSDLITGEDPDPALVALLDSAFRQRLGEARLRADGLTRGQIEDALEPPPLQTREIETGEGEGGSALAYIGALLLYIAILTFGYAVSSSVVSEKSSRVVEVVLSAIRARHLLAGKVIGVGLLGLVQIGTIAVAGLAIAVPAGAVSLPPSTAETVALVFVYFVLGYAFYGCAFAGAGSLVSRQEDSQSTTTPLLVTLIAAYIATNAALDDPDGTLAQVGTFLPPMAPLVVPGRAALGALPAWELALSLAIMLISIFVVVRLAGRIYERSVLRFGAPVKLREALGRGVHRRSRH
jgi:ABC-2 type transport system permease protein